MDDRDALDFETIMQGMAENFNATLTVNGINMRFEALRSFSIQQIKAASLQILASRKYASMPTVADFLECFSGGRAEDLAEIEAAKVWKAITQIGGYSAVCFDDPTTQAVIEYGFGGWGKLCGEMMVDQQKWFIKDFVKTYSAFTRQGIKLTGPLLGRGAGTGDNPKLIGNPEAALKIMNTPAQTERMQISSASDIAARLIGYKETAIEDDEME